MHKIPDFDLDTLVLTEAIDASAPNTKLAYEK